MNSINNLHSRLCVCGNVNRREFYNLRSTGRARVVQVSMQGTKSQTTWMHKAEYRDVELEYSCVCVFIICKCSI